MTTNTEIEGRRDKSVARAIAYSSTFIAEKAENAEIWDVEGKRYIDFCGGIGCQNIGHRHPQVVSAIKHQLDSLTHTCFQVTPYESYIALAERLNARYRSSRCLNSTSPLHSSTSLCCRHPAAPSAMERCLRLCNHTGNCCLHPKVPRHPTACRGRNSRRFALQPHTRYCGR